MKKNIVDVDENAIDNGSGSDIMEAEGDGMDLLPRHGEAVIPVEKFTKYCLDHEADYNKATAFDLALGYTKDDAEHLMANIRENLPNFPAKEKSDLGFGMMYEVRMNLTGPNGKYANVLTAWIDDNETGEMRLTNAYVDKRRSGE